MKPIKFKEQNVVFAEDQPEYLSLPALKIKSDEGYVITCWKMSFLEKIKVLFTGKIWLCLLTFNKPLTPIKFSTKKKDIFI